MQSKEIFKLLRIFNSRKRFENSPDFYFFFLHTHMGNATGSSYSRKMEASYFYNTEVYFHMDNATGSSYSRKMEASYFYNTVYFHMDM